MSIATLRLPVSLPEKRTSWFRNALRRFYDTLVEARMRAAMRELAMHRHLIPADALKESGYEARLDNGYPFTK